MWSIPNLEWHSSSHLLLNFGIHNIPCDDPKVTHHLPLPCGYMCTKKNLYGYAIFRRCNSEELFHPLKTLFTLASPNKLYILLLQRSDRISYLWETFNKPHIVANKSHKGMCIPHIIRSWPLHNGFNFIGVN